jgi:hypothetical protein
VHYDGRHAPWVCGRAAEHVPERRQRFGHPTILVGRAGAVPLDARDEEHDQYPTTALFHEAQTDLYRSVRRPRQDVFPRGSVRRVRCKKSGSQLSWALTDHNFQLLSALDPCGGAYAGCDVPRRVPGQQRKGKPLLSRMWLIPGLGKRRPRVPWLDADVTQGASGGRRAAQRVGAADGSEANPGGGRPPA